MEELYAGCFECGSRRPAVPGRLGLGPLWRILRVRGFAVRTDRMESSRGLALNPVRILCKSCAGGGTDHAGATTVSREAISGKGYLKPKCRFYYAESRIPYFIPISRKRVVLSLALEDYLIHDYDENLYRDVPDEAYIPNLVLSRKTLLLSIFCYVLILRFIELWTIIAAVIVRLVFAAIAVIVTGSFYEGVHKMMEAIWIGAALGKVVWKINECFNFIQDKMVEFVMKRTMTGTFDYLKKSGIPRGQGIRLWNR